MKNFILLLLTALTSGTVVLATQDPAKQNDLKTEAASAATALQATDAVRHGTPSANVENANSKRTAAPANLPYGVDEILKMTQGGIEAGVIQSYIAQSTIAYNLSADDILSLHKLGIAPQIVATLIRRGGEVRAQSAQQLKDGQAQMAQQTPTVVANPNPVSIYVPAPQPATTTYIVESPRYVYAGYPSYSYSYVAPFYLGYSYRGYNCFSNPRTYFHGSYFPSHRSVVHTGLNSGHFRSSTPSFRHRGR